MRLSTHALILRYSAFAVVAIVANLGAQRLVLGLGPTQTWLLPAMVVGTAVGLVVKYALDKRFIFFDHSSGLRAHSSRFSRYTAMGLFTTALFWATEAGFWWIWQTTLAREVGAVLGLAMGYMLKYWLDKRFVFNRGMG